MIGYVSSFIGMAPNGGGGGGYCDHSVYSRPGKRVNACSNWRLRTEGGTGSVVSIAVSLVAPVRRAFCGVGG